MRIDLPNALCENTYPGRGIVHGPQLRTAGMRRSRISLWEEAKIRETAFLRKMRQTGFVPAHMTNQKLVDPSLIIYSPVHVLENHLIVTNGDQTDTIYDYIKDGKTFEEALRTRTFEPDRPELYPAHFRCRDVELENDFAYKLSIFEIAPMGTAVLDTAAIFFDYDAAASRARAISSTPMRGTGTRCRAFEGEPDAGRSSARGSWTRLPRWCGLRFECRQQGQPCLRAYVDLATGGDCNPDREQASVNREEFSMANELCC